MSAVVWRNPGIRIEPDMTSSLAQKLYGNTVDMPLGPKRPGKDRLREWKYQCDAS